MKWLLCKNVSACTSDKKILLCQSCNFEWGQALELLFEYHQIFDAETQGILIFLPVKMQR